MLPKTTNAEFVKLDWLMLSLNVTEIVVLGSDARAFLPGVTEVTARVP